MNKFERENLKWRFLRLAGMKATGTPAELAARFGINERSVKRMARELRDEGHVLWFCQVRNTYVTDKMYS